jgi:hypothetical protein
MTSNPFEIAERYITLRERCVPVSWGDIILFFNEMVTGPLITLFLLFMGSRDPLMVISAITRAYSAWSDWEEYHALRGDVQQMFLMTMLNGGPKITTNDMKYLPYVFADAVVRLGLPHPHPSRRGFLQELSQHMPYIPHMSDFLAYLKQLP